MPTLFFSCSTNKIQQAVKNAAHVLVNLYIERPKYEVASRFEIFRSRGVPYHFDVGAMRGAIDLNDNAMFATQEIYEEWPNWRLPDELVSFQAAMTEFGPQSLLCGRL
jgi:hypothetical protein